MKGTLGVFKEQVNDKVEDVYKNYRNDFETICGIKDNNSSSELNLLSTNSKFLNKLLK